MSFFAGLELEHDGADQTVISAFVEEVVIQHFYGHVLQSPTVTKLFRQHVASLLSWLVIVRLHGVTWPGKAGREGGPIRGALSRLKRNQMTTNVQNRRRAGEAFEDPTKRTWTAVPNSGSSHCAPPLLILL